MNLSLLKIQPSQWKKILRRNFNRLDSLADFLELTAEQRKILFNRPCFPINIPERLVHKMTKGNIENPLFRQFVPTYEENEKNADFMLDPVGDAHFCRESKLLHKYEGRVLLVCTSACAMHCRYCFRQNFNYDTQDKTFERELKVIAEDLTIQEVILSGGDPLSLSDDVLDGILTQLNQMDHIKRIRFHTRFPIGIPERIDESFLKILQRVKKQIWFVIHTNHPDELDQDVFHYLRKLQLIGCTLLNQSVLLKGVNDDVDTLRQLCALLIDNGIMPYYLHQLDRVQGAAHFEVSEDKGLDLIKILACSLPGYGVPKYVREEMGKPHKTGL